MTSLDQLPEDVLISILQYAGPEHVWGGLSQTCRRIWQICDSSVSLWKDLYETYCLEVAMVPAKELDSGAFLSMSYKSRIHKQTQINKEVKKALKQLCTIPTYRSRMESIDTICQYKARAYPMLYRANQQAKPTDDYGLSLLYWSRELMTVCNYLFGSDKLMALADSEKQHKPDYEPVDNFISIVFHCGLLCENHDIRGFWDALDKLKASADETYKQILVTKKVPLNNVYQLCRSIIEEIWLDMDLNLVVDTQQYGSSVSDLPQYVNRAIDKVSSSSDMLRVNSFFLGCIIVYYFRRFGIDVQLLNDTVYGQLVARVDMKKDSFEADQVPQEYILSNGNAVFFVDTTNLVEFRTLDYVNEMFPNDTEQTLIHIDTTSDLTKRILSYYNFFERSSNSGIVGTVISPELLQCLIPEADDKTAQEHESEAALQLSKVINNKFKHMFPILENIAAHRSRLRSILAASIANIASEFILPETDLRTNTKERSPGTPLRHYIGEVIKTDSYPEWGCIIGWNEMYDFEEEVHPSASVPTYKVLMPTALGSRNDWNLFTVPQTIIKKVDDFTSDENRTNLNTLITTHGSYELGKYFVRWDPISNRFVPSRWLAAEYPDDYLYITGH